MRSTLLGRTLTLAGVIGVTAFVTARVVSKPDQHPADATQAEPDAMMQAWMKAAQPGPEHKRLMKFAGKWKQKITQWPAPGVEPTESISHAHDEAVFGGRYLIEHVHGDVTAAGGASTPFDGMGIYGYDNIKQKYVFAWIDSMGTMIMTGEGDPDPHQNVVTYYSDLPNPLNGKTTKIKMIRRVFNDNEYGLQWFEDTGDGVWRKSMDLVASRE